MFTTEDLTNLDNVFLLARQATVANKPNLINLLTFEQSFLQKIAQVNAENSVEKENDKAEEVTS